MITVRMSLIFTLQTPRRVDIVSSIHPTEYEEEYIREEWMPRVVARIEAIECPSKICEMEREREGRSYDQARRERW